MITLTDEQAEQLCDQCHYPYICSAEELEQHCWNCVLCEDGEENESKKIC